MKTLRDIQLELRRTMTALNTFATNDILEFRILEMHYHKLKDEYEELRHMAAMNKHEGLYGEM